MSHLSSPTLSPVYDGLDVSVTSNITRFHRNHSYDMVSRRIYQPFFYGGRSITRRTDYDDSNDVTRAWLKWCGDHVVVAPPPGTHATIEVYRFLANGP